MSAEPAKLWCDTCDRSVDAEVLDDGNCPLCGSRVTTGERQALPWKFRLMIGATVIYLGWRLYQLVVWLSH